MMPSSPQTPVDEQGLLSYCKFEPSPNCDERPVGDIRLIVIHNISLPPDQYGGDGVQRLFTNTLNVADHPYYRQIAGLRVSAHFFVRRDGQIIQFVSCFRRAWHAGQSNWQGLPNCNDFSVGIELEGSDSVPFADPQYAALNRLTRSLRSSFPIRGIAGHSDVSPQRKTDPGPCFDWFRYLCGLCDA
jgi:AmpD protein